jgi:hypothetical protein
VLLDSPPVLANQRNVACRLRKSSTMLSLSLRELLAHSLCIAERSPLGHLARHPGLPIDSQCPGKPASRQAWGSLPIARTRTKLKAQSSLLQ